MEVVLDIDGGVVSGVIVVVSVMVILLESPGSVVLELVVDEVGEVEELETVGGVEDGDGEVGAEIVGVGVLPGGVAEICHRELSDCRHQ